MSRPTLDAAITALRCAEPRFPWVKPTPDEGEVADLLEELAAIHVPSSDQADNPEDDRILRTYGICTGCGETWPCAGWVHAEQLAVQWLGRAADRVYAHAKTAADNIGKTGAA